MSQITVIIDREEISELNRTINEACINADIEARYNAAIAYMLLDNNDKAHSLTEKSTNSNDIQVFSPYFSVALLKFFDVFTSIIQAEIAMIICFSLSFFKLGLNFALAKI